MHYYALVVIPEESTDIEAAVASAMGPHEENWDEETHTGFWDWWQVGGRYTGRITGYDPRTDPANYSVCEFCKGTGVRKDEIAASSGTHLREITEPNHPRFGERGWCNGCDGRGMRLNWDLRPYPGDIGRAKDVKSRPFTLVTPAGVTHREDWTGEDWRDQSEAMEAAWSALDPNARVVVVDYHS